MPTIYSSTVPESVQCNGATVTNLGPGTVYYAASPNPTSASNDGSLATNAAVVLDGTQWFVSNGRAELKLDPAPAARVDNQLPGIVAPTGYPATGTVTVTANRAHVCRFVTPRTIVVKSIAFVVSTVASVDDPCDVGIYDANLNRLVSVGATSGKLITTTGLKSISLSTPYVLTANTVYFAAHSVGTVGGTAAVLVAADAKDVGACDLFAATPGTADGTTFGQFKAASHPLPTSLSSLTRVQTPPIIALREF